MRIIGGKLKGRRLSPPRQGGVRPTTDFARESLFNLLDDRVDIAQCETLDLFCGTGAISFELASRGARSVTSVDMNPRLLGFIREQAGNLQLPIRTVRADVFRWLKKPHGSFNLIIADPPYQVKHHEDIPNFVLNGGFLREGGWLVVEHPGALDFSKHPKFESHRAYGSVHFSFFTH